MVIIVDVGKEINMKITYDAFDTTGVAETFVIDTISLTNSGKEYLGDLDYRVLEGDISLLSDEHLLDMEIYCTHEYIRLFNDYMDN